MPLAAPPPAARGLAAPGAGAPVSLLMLTVLLLLCALPFAAHQLGLAGLGSEQAYRKAILRWALRPEVAFGEWWRLLSAGLVHAPLLSWPDSLHVGSNALFLLLLGPLLERQLGKARFAVSVLLCLLGGNLLSLAWGDELPGSLGASGALFGLIGVLAGLVLPHRGWIEAAEFRAYRGFFLLFLGLQLLSWFLLEPWTSVRLGHAGHLGGFLTGVGLGWAFAPSVLARPGQRSRRWVWVALFWGAPLLAFAGHRIWRYRQLFDAPPAHFDDYHRIEQAQREPCGGRPC